MKFKVMRKKKSLKLPFITCITSVVQKITKVYLLLSTVNNVPYKQGKIYAKCEYLGASLAVCQASWMKCYIE